MTTGVKECAARPTIKETVKILRDNDVDVREYFDAGIHRFYPSPSIFFRGGDSEGHRAVEILEGHNVGVIRLYREWFYGPYSRTTWAVEIWTEKVHAFAKSATVT